MDKTKILWLVGGIALYFLMRKSETTSTGLLENVTVVTDSEAIKKNPEIEALIKAVRDYERK